MTMVMDSLDAVVDTLESLYGADATQTLPDFSSAVGRYHERRDRMSTSTPDIGTCHSTVGSCEPTNPSCYGYPNASTCLF